MDIAKIAPTDAAADILFHPYRGDGLEVPNRIAMAPMTREFARGGVNGEDKLVYYRRRAAGGVGLIITEGTWIDVPSASNRAEAPRFYGEDALAAWKRIVQAVHSEGARIMPQLWHTGMARVPGTGAHPDAPSQGPSGIDKSYRQVVPPMGVRDIEATVDAYARAAVAAKEIGCDGVELHGAHGYLIDQFFWERTNLRSDRYGGDLKARTRFAVEFVHEIRRRCGSGFPVALRFSQWKFGDYAIRMFATPRDLEIFLDPLVAAGVDIFHASTRRYWDAAFEGSPLGLAGWTKKLTGRTTIAVGSVTLRAPFDPKASLAAGDLNHSEADRSLAPLIERMERGEFDLIALGRTLLTNPDWPQLVREGRMDALRPYDATARDTLD